MAFSAQDNAIIFAAQNGGLPSVAVSPVTIPNGMVLQFEVADRVSIHGYRAWV